MVDVGRRKLQWQKNLEQAASPEDRKQQYAPAELVSLRLHYDVPAELAAQINTEIANYNRDRNALSLWNVLTICVENQIPIPEQVGDFFLDISQKLVGYAHNGEKQARQLISDVVLGTKNEGGGRGAFRSFQSAEKEREIVCRVGEIAMQQVERAFPEHETLDAIYAIVGDEFRVDEDHVRKLVQLYEGDTGSFDIRALFKAATSSPRVFASGLDTTTAKPDGEFHSEEPSDGILSHGIWKVSR